MTRARRHITNIQWALQLNQDAYRDYAWEVRDALQGWENEKRLAAYLQRRLG